MSKFPKSFSDYWSIGVATVFGSGYSPFAPGTAGSVIGVLMWWAASLFFPAYAVAFDWKIQLMLIVGSLAKGYLACAKLDAHWGHDNQKIVIDEVFGVFITLFFVPVTWINLLLGLILFRVFDIWKPLGIRQIDNWEHPMAVMLDDGLAGIYAAVVLQGILFFAIG